VVAHEEFMALPASKIFQIPNAAITDWFPEERHFVTQTLLYADEILFTDEPGIFEEPPALKGRIHYIGPAIREFKYGPKDKQQARQELGVEANAKVVTVLPGSWTEAKTPVFDLVTSAFRSLPLPNKNLIWIAGQDYDLLTSRANQNPENLSHTEIKQQDWQIDRLMVASDLVLTKASRETHKELNALRVQSISLSFGLNSPDDKRAEKFRRNTALDARGLTPEALSQVIHQQLNNPLDPPQSEPSNNGRQQAASRLATRLHEIRAHGL
jgi:UDP-N-acetylglucosamine:LPS N-acetylglucosamine transferase